MADLRNRFAALWNRKSHCTFALWFLPFFFLLLSSFFLAYSQRSEIGCLPYFYTWCGHSANLHYNTGLKCAAHGSLEIQDAKWHKLRRISTIGKKLVKQQYVLHMSSQYGELGPTNGWDRFGSLGHPSKFQRVSCLAFVTAATSPTGDQPNFPRCFTVSRAGTFSRDLAPDRILPGARFTVRPSLALAYFGSVTAWHSSSGRQPNCGVVQGMELRNFCRGRHLLYIKNKKCT